MKKITFILVLLAGSFSMFSCMKQDARPNSTTTDQVTVNATVATGETYSLDLRSYGSDAVINTQPANFAVSTINAGPVYQYSYSTKSAVAEQVVITVTKGGGQGRCNHSSEKTIVKVNLQVQ